MAGWFRRGIEQGATKGRTAGALGCQFCRQQLNRCASSAELRVADLQIPETRSRMRTVQSSVAHRFTVNPMLVDQAEHL